MRWLMLALVLMLGGCANDWTDARERADQASKIYPENYRSDILQFMRTYLNDPSNVRDAFISEPAQRSPDGVTRYTVCLRYNAKKSGGQYAGSKDSIALFRAGRLDHVIDSAREICKDAAYQPFPELQGMTR